MTCLLFSTACASSHSGAAGRQSGHAEVSLLLQENRLKVRTMHLVCLLTTVSVPVR